LALLFTVKSPPHITTEARTRIIIFVAVTRIATLQFESSMSIVVTDCHKGRSIPTPVIQIQKMFSLHGSHINSSELKVKSYFFERL
jgi:hypothetical protein